MRGRELVRLIRSALLVAVLLIAQAAVASHVDLDDLHPAGESCVLCAGASVLGAGNVAAVAGFDVVVTATRPQCDVWSAIPRIHTRHFLARGPPAAS